MFTITPSRILRIICIIFLVISIFFSFLYHKKPQLEKYYSQNVRVVGIVTDVDDTDTNQKIVIDNLVVNDRLIEDKVLIFAPLYPPLKYGDRISANCILNKPEPFSGFRYDRYLASKNIYATCFSNSVPFVLDVKQGNEIMNLIFKYRSRFILHLDKVFGEPDGSLLVGLLLGEQRFSEGWKEKFLRTGTTHIVAASGYNVFVVTTIMIGLFAIAGIKRNRAFAFIIASVAGYVILAGADAAVVRAGVMGVIVLFARFLGRSSTMVNVLLLTASIMLLNSPLIIFDAGFRLSMLSTIALIYLAPVLDKKLEFIPNIFEIRTSISATLSATYMALPIIITSFKSFSLVSVFTNLMILPFIPYIMLFGFIAVMVSFVSMKLAILVSVFAWSLLSLILWVINLMSALPLFISDIPIYISELVLFIWLISIFYIWKLIKYQSSKPV